jgi:hypothetical protein
LADVSNPSFIRSLKLALGEREDYEKVDHYRSKSTKLWQDPPVISLLVETLSIKGGHTLEDQDKDDVDEEDDIVVLSVAALYDDDALLLFVVIVVFEFELFCTGYISLKSSFILTTVQFLF